MNEAVTRVRVAEAIDEAFAVVDALPFCVKCNGKPTLNAVITSEETAWRVNCQVCGAGEPPMASFGMAVDQWRKDNPVSKEDDKLLRCRCGGQAREPEAVTVETSLVLPWGTAIRDVSRQSMVAIRCSKDSRHCVVGESTARAVEAWQAVQQRYCPECGSFVRADRTGGGEGERCTSIWHDSRDTVLSSEVVPADKLLQRGNDAG